ncbi:hypothetical protein EF847_08025 [Actinobacteria bacterium YIM 96077]|uniref:LPXTG cell wall anchor domain-containing protein n=1 Tax=Phytoactinopolyspora halophila TaxID=1981511 RepID=A0A329QGU8_9ACTN|nr:hypothetical protein EF847_08025 [Actinobacteria bacterium YIM 96077]RAW10582.1 hypothetical protein DPM12_18730 [Phytoactinopolyspora halophila]
MTTLGLGLGVSIALAAPASATSETGPEGQTVTVSKSQELDPDGETITVSGSGFDLNTGIYVVLCVDNGPGQQPTPCLGGMDMEGGTGSSAWISSNPPSYGEGLAQPFDEENGTGSFSVQLTVSAADEYTDCLDTSIAPNGCVVGTRADHTRSADRSADVLIPVTFATSGSDEQSKAGNSDEAGDGAGGEDGNESGGVPGESADGGAASGASPNADDDTNDGLAATGSSTTAPLVAGALALIAGPAVLAVARHRSATPGSPTPSS